MIITGMVTDVRKPHSTDKWGNQYQYVTVNSPAGPIIGVKASKEVLTQNFIGQEVEWECESAKDNQGRTYNKFKRPQQQGYQQPPQAPPQAPAQPMSQNLGQSTPKDQLIVNQVVYKALVELEVAGQLSRSEYSTRFEDDVNLIMFGKDPRNIPDMDPGF